MIQWPAKVAQIFGKMLLAMRPGRLWLLHWLGECRSWKLERWCRLLVLMRTLSNERLCRVCERASLFMTGQQQLVEKLQPLSHQVCLVTLGSVIVLIIFSPLWMDLCRQPFPRPIPFSLPGETVDCFVCTTDCALRRLRARDGGQDLDEHALCGAGLCHGRSDDDRKKSGVDLKLLLGFDDATIYDSLCAANLVNACQITQDIAHLYGCRVCR